MTQTPWNIPPDGETRAGAWIKGELATALAALRTFNAGATEPAATAAYMPWLDTTTALLKIRNAADSAWDIVGPVGAPSSRDAARAELVSLSATATKLLWSPGAAFTVTRVVLISDTASTSSSGNEWTFKVTRDPSGTPLELFSSSPGTFTSVGGVGGGAEFVADTVWTLTPDQNAALPADTVLEFTATKAGTATTLATLLVLVEGYYTA